MTIDIAQLDAATDAEAAVQLAACCGASTWVAGMIARRPFRSRDRLLAAADEVSDTLGERDWREAFQHHPRIGEQHASTAVCNTAAQWSAAEQAGASVANADVQSALALATRA